MHLSLCCETSTHYGLSCRMPLPNLSPGRKYSSAHMPTHERTAFSLSYVKVKENVLCVFLSADRGSVASQTDSIHTDNVLSLLYILLNLSLLTVHKSIYPTMVDFFILLSSLFLFRMHTSTTNPGMPVHVTERLLMTFCHAQTK